MLTRGKIMRPYLEKKKQKRALVAYGVEHLQKISK
jgi:hypothetical protein